MKTEMISLLVSSISILVAMWSLYEAKITRKENHRYKALNRRTELLILLSEVQQKAGDVSLIALDCLGQIIDSEWKRIGEHGHKLDNALDARNYTQALQQNIMALKEELKEDQTFAALEQWYGEYGGILQDLESRRVILNRIYEFAKGITAASVNEDRVC